MTKLPYLNLGCGSTFDPRWINIDFWSTGDGVIAHNLLHGIPQADAQFALVYHSHVLEHFPKEQAPRFLRECHRVLRPGGILRVAVPNLEQIARTYLQHLEDALRAVPLAREKYEWSVIEMLDQTVRTTSGGEMVKYVADRAKNNDAYLLERNGEELRGLMTQIRSEHPTPPAGNNGQAASGRPRIRVRQKLLQLLLGKSYPLLEEVRFRHSGEIHQWMYDRFSLAELLREAGFRSSHPTTAFESKIPNWPSFKLDGDPVTGRVRKPDSLFMEAVK